MLSTAAGGPISLTCLLRCTHSAHGLKSAVPAAAANAPHCSTAVPVCSAHAQPASTTAAYSGGNGMIWLSKARCVCVLLLRQQRTHHAAATPVQACTCSQHPTASHNGRNCFSCRSKLHFHVGRNCWLSRTAALSQRQELHQLRLQLPLPLLLCQQRLHLLHLALLQAAAVPREEAPAMVRGFGLMPCQARGWMEPDQCCSCCCAALPAASPPPCCSCCCCMQPGKPAPCCCGCCAAQRRKKSPCCSCCCRETRHQSCSCCCCSRRAVQLQQHLLLFLHLLLHIVH